MPAFQDLTGQKFGRLTVIERAENMKTQVAWSCRCECGEWVKVRAMSLKSRDTQSCGCLQSELNTIRATVHGESPRSGVTTEYGTWRDMIQRTTNPGSHDFCRYGGRGIGVCEQWKSFDNFLADVGRKPSPQHSLDRINNNLGYSPENCRWATPIEQARNTRRTRMLTYRGQDKCLAEWAELLGFCAMTMHYRISTKKMTVEDAFETSIRGRRKP